MPGSRGAVAAVVLLLAGTADAAQQHEGHSGAEPEKLGKVHFATSCHPKTAADFDRAVALLHSFWFSASIDAFRGVLAQDASCGVAYWGIALGQWGNPFAGRRSPALIEEAQKTIEKAKSVGARTARERDYLAAVENLYREADKLDERARMLAYERALEQLVHTYPRDSEAAIFYALSLCANAPPSDKSYEKLLKAAAILEKEFEKQPEHPGLAHYIIHAYDVPPLAPRALDAARRYAQIAPSAPHALHMPSHTFTRVGLWQESIQSNIASALAARKANSPGEVLHAFDYQVYAYLQGAQDKAAKRIVEEADGIGRALAGEGGYGLAGAFALAAIPARYALERGAWSDAAALEPRKTPLPYTEAITQFARALGAARSGNAAAAKAEADRLSGLRDALANDEYWAEQVDIQGKAAAAWALFADGKKDAALALLRTAAEQEESTEKSAVTPGPLAPASELLGEMLLEAQRAQEALAAFEATLKKEPNRFRALAGAARSAEAAGERQKAQAYHAQLLEVAKQSDSERPELQAARRYLESARARKR
jgi:hypothetical protein